MPHRPSVEPLEARIAPAFAPIFNLAGLDGTNGFAIQPAGALAAFGTTVSDAGDINGDGYDDVLIAASQVNQVCLVFGKAGGFGASFELNSLNGVNGFRMNGASAGMSAGDFNGDGFDDIMLTASSVAPPSLSNRAYIVFGKASGFAATLNVNALNGTNGVQFLNSTASGSREFGRANAAGDVNGDGFDDVVIGDRLDPGQENGNFPGAAFVIFGKSGVFTPTFDVQTLNGANGFKLNGSGERAYVGVTVASAGDVNGDGFDEVLVGGSNLEPAYLVFGKGAGFPAKLDLATLDGVNGTTFAGNESIDRRARVRSAGDVNGDGLADLIIHAGSSSFATSNTVTSYVVFGSRTGFGAQLSLPSLTADRGFKIQSTVTERYGSHAVSSAGDINGDGFDDLLVGSYRADSPTVNNGATYVIFGKAGSFGTSVDVTSLNGTNGFRVEGLAAGDSLGISTSSAGDVNGDGVDDIIIGAYGADANGSNSGAGYVIFGGGGLRISDASLSEGNSGTTNAVFTVTLPTASADPVSVRYSTHDGSARGGSDFTAIENELLTFGPGETQKTISVAVSGDLIYEVDEAFTVVLSEPINVPITRGTATGLIRNDDAAPIVSIAPISVLEGDAGTTSAAFTVTLSAPVGAPVSVRYATADGSAVAGVDYTALAATQLTFAEGETTKTIVVEVSGDTEVEAPEAFSVILSNPVNATIATAVATGTILNDDTRVSISDVTVREGHAGSQPLTFAVTLSAPSALPVTVTYEFLDGTAAAGTDYQHRGSSEFTVLFAPGETSKTIPDPGDNSAVVEVLGDTLVESDESFSVHLAGAANAVIEKDTGLATILDDDLTIVGKRKATFTDVDGDLVTITVNKGTLKAEDFTVFSSGLGSQLALIDFSGEEDFAGANLTISAKRSPGSIAGARLVDVGYINASGIDLGKIVIKGDLGQIDAGNDLDPRPGVLSLAANSLGKRGLVTQLPGGSAESEITGTLKALKLATDLQDATLSVSGDIGSIAIGDSLRGSVIRSDGKIGAIKINNDFAASSTHDAVISARGHLSPKTNGEAATIGSLKVGGSVNHAQILAGYDRSGAAVNGDVRIGPMSVGGDWIASNLIAGAGAGGDQLFGTDDDRAISSANPVVAKIASILIKGSAVGTTGGTDHFGFVAEEIGAFKAGGVKFTLQKGAGNDLDGLAVGASGDLRVLEVVQG